VAAAADWRCMAALQGSLESVRLPALLTLLAQQRKTGYLRVLQGHLSGDLYFASGEITSAVAGMERGLDALDAILLVMARGDFAFVEDPASATPPAPNVHLQGAALQEHIRETAGRAEALRAAVPSLTAVPRPVSRRPSPPHPTGLAPATADLLAAVDGRRTVQELATGRGLAQTLTGLATLRRAGLIVFDDLPPGGGGSGGGGDPGRRRSASGTSWRRSSLTPPRPTTRWSSPARRGRCYDGPSPRTTRT